MRTFWKIVVAVAFVALVGGYAVWWFTPDSPAELARTGRCEEYREAMGRTEAGLDDETQASPGEIDLVLDECEKQGR